MPDFGIGEALAAIGAFASDALAGGAGAIGAGLGEAAGAAGAGLGALGAGAGDLLGGAGGALEGLLGGGAAAGEGGAALGADVLGGLSAAPGGAAAGGLAPAGAGAIDLASATGAGGELGIDLTAASPVATDISAQDWILGGNLLPGTAGDVAGAGVSTFGQEAAGGDLAALVGGGGGSAAGGGGGLASAAGGVLGQPAATGAVGGSGSFLDSLISGAGASVAKNPIGIGLAGAGLGLNLLQGSKTDPNQAILQNQANQLTGQSAQLQSYLQTGQLPPGLKAALDNATASAKAHIISGYAARGQNADPNQNSALAQELAQVDMNAVASQGDIATKLLQTGLNEAQMSQQIYQFLLGVDQKQQQQTAQAIANFAAALGGAGKAPVIQIGGTTTTG